MVQIPNIFANGMAAFDDQTQRLNAFAQNRASKEAGAAIAGGDYQGGSDVLNRAGMLPQAHNVLADQQVLQDRKASSDQATIDRAQKAKEIQIAGLSKITEALQTVPEGHRAEWLKQQIPLIQQLGVPVESFANMDEGQLTNAALGPWKAMLGKAQADYNIGSVRYSGATNKPIAGFLETKPGTNLYAVGDGPDAAGAPADPASPPAAASEPTAAPPSGVRGVRNNNALNLTNLPHGQWAGQIGSDGRFAVFDNVESSYAAADRNLQAYATHHGINTLSGIINRWAPKGDGANNPTAYIQTVSQDTGIDPNQTLNLADPKVRGVILHSMSKVELGGSGASNGPQVAASQSPAPAAQPAAPARIPGFHSISQASPEWENLPDGRQRNRITGKIEGTPTAAEEQSLSPDAVALVGAQYLQLGPDALKNMGQGKSGVKNKDAVMEWVAKTAKEAGTSNPTLVARFAQNKANVEALKQNTKMLTQISASAHTLDTNLDYAMTFAKRGVGPTGVPLLDTPINKLREQLGSVDAKNLDNLLTTTGNEYAKILSSTTGTGGATSDSARAEAQRLIHPGMTLRQLTSAIQIAKTEAGNRRMSYAGENQRLTSDISGVPQAADAPKVRKYNPVSGKLE